MFHTWTSSRRSWISLIERRKQSTRSSWSSMENTIGACTRMAFLSTKKLLDSRKKGSLEGWVVRVQSSPVLGCTFWTNYAGYHCHNNEYWLPFRPSQKSTVHQAWAIFVETAATVEVNFCIFIQFAVTVVHESGVSDHTSSTIISISLREPEILCSSVLQS